MNIGIACQVLHDSVWVHSGEEGPLSSSCVKRSITGDDERRPSGFDLFVDRTSIHACKWLTPLNCDGRNAEPIPFQSNVSAIGPLALVAVIYVIIGFTFGILIREFCYVPRNFWQGLVVATGMSNWGNLREYSFTRIHIARISV